MTKAPERLWAHTEYEDDGETFIEFLSDEPWPGEDVGVEYTRTDLSNALIAAAYEAAAEACTNVIQNYDVMDGSGSKFLPLKTQQAARGMVSLAREDIRALTPADARAALERVAQPRWYRMDDAENPPPEYRHIRGLWVVSAQTKERLYFQADLGHIHDETGEFVDQYDEDFGFAAEDYTHWTPLLAPPEDEG